MKPCEDSIAITGSPKGIDAERDYVDKIKLPF
jgi:hypothetical protein